MERSVLLLSIPLLLIFFSPDHIDAAEKVANLTVNNGTDASLKLEAKDQGGKLGVDKEGSKETDVKEEEKPVEEAKTGEENGKGNLDEKELGVGKSQECDPANRCIVEKSFVACLRVPGKDSLDLSLLIQNKGTGSLDVDIYAPDPEFVTVELQTVQLKGKEDKEVKVSVKDGGNDTVIILKSSEGTCSLNFQNTVLDTSKKSESSIQPRRLIRLSIRSSIMLAAFAFVLLVALTLSFVRFWKIKTQEGGTRYQQVDDGLPVSIGGKKEATDGWDNSWVEDWDDEEAPMTPSKPVLTPSSKGLNSRKLSKDNWKD